MALSLSISTSQGTQSVANNTTQLTVNVNISWTYGSYDHYGSSKYVTINGKTYYFMETERGIFRGGECSFRHGKRHGGFYGRNGSGYGSS